MFFDLNVFYLTFCRLIIMFYLNFSDFFIIIILYSAMSNNAVVMDYRKINNYYT